jgi:hypothetical protein
VSTLFSGEFDAEYASPYSRDVEGRLIRAEAPTEDDRNTKVHLTIDGTAVEVPGATLWTNDLGGVMNDERGFALLRETTIDDAAVNHVGIAGLPSDTSSSTRGSRRPTCSSSTAET